MVAAVKLLHAAGLRSENAKGLGMRTEWPDRQGQWSIVQIGKVMARGCSLLEKLRVSVELSDQLERGADQVMNEKHDFSRQAKDKCVLMFETSAEPAFSEAWGRPPR